MKLKIGQYCIDLCHVLNDNLYIRNELLVVLLNTKDNSHAWR